MATQVVRLAGVAKYSKAHAGHVWGDEDARPKEARARSEHGGVRAMILGGEQQRAEQLIKEVRRQKRPGRKAAEVVDFVIAGPPRFGAEDAWPKEKVVEWAVASSAWLEKLMGPKPILIASSLHLDESAPHVHAAFVPVSGADSRGPKLSLKSLRIERFGGLRDPRRQLTWLQDSYQKEVGVKFGLDRGGGIEGRP